MRRFVPLALPLVCATALFLPRLDAQVGRRFPSEKRIVSDPVTGVPLEFLTTGHKGDSKIYQTHPDWTSDGKWVLFCSSQEPGQAFAVEEQSGTIVQLTDRGYLGMLCLSRRAMKLYLMRDAGAPAPRPRGDAASLGSATSAYPGFGGPADASGRQRVPRLPVGPFQIVEVDLQALLSDSMAGRPARAGGYERVCGTIPSQIRANGNMGLDADETAVYFAASGPSVTESLPAGTKVEGTFGPRGMGAGPSGIAAMDLSTGKVRIVCAVPFQIGHVQTNPWVKGEVVFCWETGGKAPQRTWIVESDGSGLRPLYPEAPYEWITHEAVITRDEVAIAILAHRRPGVPANDPWGPSGTGEHPTGVGIVNLRTREMRIIGQVPFGDPGRSIWHVNGSADGRWAVADDFKFRIWIIDRKTCEMKLLASMGEKTTAADHIHPTFNADGTKIEVQTAMLSDDGRNLNICVVPMPEDWLRRR